MNKTKVCTRCKRELQISEFSKRGNGLAYECKSCVATRQSALIRKYRWEALTRYGGIPPKCACCGEIGLEFLAIDHTLGNGAQHRKETKYSTLSHWVVKHDFPDGFRVLCHNCNQSRGFYGYCPHETESVVMREIDRFTNRIPQKKCRKTGGCPSVQDGVNGDIWKRPFRYYRRYEVLSHYSDGIPTCACCGEQHIEFLAMDHINGGGYQHFKERRGEPITDWLRRNGYPDGYQVLCHNCNNARGFYGYCPHTEDSTFFEPIQQAEDNRNIQSRGRKRKLSNDDINSLKKRVENGEHISALALEYGVSRTTITTHCGTRRLLSGKQIEEIHTRLIAGQKQARLAREFGVSNYIITKIKNGNYDGKHENGAKRSFTDEQVLEIRNHDPKHEGLAALRTKFNTSDATIWRIRNRMHYKDVPG